MICAHICMSISFVLYAVSLKSTLYIATGLLGICYGIQYSTMVPTASEIFGLKNFGVIYNSMALGNPIGAILFSALLAGYVYDAEAARQGSSTCLGANCFRPTFLVLAGACGVGTILSIILTIRVRPVYKLLYAGGSFRLPSSSNHWRFELNYYLIGSRHTSFAEILFNKVSYLGNILWRAFEMYC